MNIIKRKVSEMRNGFYENEFDRYDRLRREKEFEILKDVCKYNYGIDDVHKRSFKIPVFNKNKEMEFSILIQNDMDEYRVKIVFKDYNMIKEFQEKQGFHVNLALTLKEVDKSITRLIYRMRDLLETDELYFTEITEDEHNELFRSTSDAFIALEGGEA